MKISRKAHQFIRLQNIIFTLLFVGALGLLAWLSTQYSIQSDWTVNSRNSLSAPSITLIDKLKSPINIVAYASENDILRQQITLLINKYQQHKSDITLTIVNPDMKPEQARQEGITTNGELVIQYNGRRESLKQLNEQALSNALQRLANSEERWVVFLSGHGERNPASDANFNFSVFTAELKNKGINSQSINLIETPSIPVNTSLLVIANPQSLLLEGEVKLIKEYLLAGHALLVLTEPKQTPYTQAILDTLGLSTLPGIVVDGSTQMYGIDDPTFALITQYPPHIATQHIQVMSLFPGAVGLTANNNSAYHAQPLLSTLERSWTEVSPIEGNITFDDNTDEQKGPIAIAYALNNKTNEKQRVAVIGDADFLSNAFLGNGANLDLGISLIQWLSHDDTLIDILAKTASDVRLVVDQTWPLIFGLGFLFALPILFITTGVIIWFRRKKY